YLLTHSFGGRALAILRVVSNSGARTPGVDGDIWDTPEAKSAAFSALRRRGYQPQPLRRVYIAKSNGKQRPLGIPVMADSAAQALHLLGLDPIAESLADGHSYGRLEPDEAQVSRTVLRGRAAGDGRPLPDRRCLPLGSMKRGNCDGGCLLRPVLRCRGLCFPHDSEGPVDRRFPESDADSRHY